MRVGSWLEHGEQRMTAHAKVAAVLASRTRHICRMTVPQNGNDFQVVAVADITIDSIPARSARCGLKVNMINSPVADWTSDISKQLRALIDAGANDAQLDRLILARRCGDNRLMARVIDEVAALQSSVRPACSEGPATDLVRLQQQTLSLVVNELSATKLHAFVSWLQPLSELVHDKYRSEAFWSYRPALAIVARALCDDVLARIDSAADKPPDECKLPAEGR